MGRYRVARTCVCGYSTNDRSSFIRHLNRCKEAKAKKSLPSGKDLPQKVPKTEPPPEEMVPKGEENEPESESTPDLQPVIHNQTSMVPGTLIPSYNSQNVNSIITALAKRVELLEVKMSKLLEDRPIQDDSETSQEANAYSFRIDYLISQVEDMEGKMAFLERSNKN